MPHTRLDRLFARLRLAPVELLAVSSRSNVFLAACLPGADDPGWAGWPGAGARVALKVRFAEPAPGPPARGIGWGGAGRETATTPLERELRVLGRRPIAAMPRLLRHDPARATQVALVLSACPGRPLAAVRSLAPEAGERARAQLRADLAALHAAGIAHGGLNDRAVLVAPDGALTVLGFGRARFASEPGFESACAADRAALPSLSTRLTAAAPERRRRMHTHSRPAPVPPEHRLSVPAECRPSAPSEHPEPSARPLGLRTVVREPSGWETTVEPPAVVAEPRLVEVLDPALAAVGEGLRGVRSWARHSAGTRRARLVVAAVAAAVLLAGALAILLPATPGGDPAQLSATAESDRDRLADARDDRTPVDAAIAGARIGDDPVAAGVALLTARRACFAAGDQECLTPVEQWGAPAWRDDRAALADPEARAQVVGEEIPPLHLVQHFGGVVLLASAQTTPASLLVVRGEAGWRIRRWDPGG